MSLPVGYLQALSILSRQAIQTVDNLLTIESNLKNYKLMSKIYLIAK